MRTEALIASVIVPILLAMMTGYYLKRSKIVSPAGASDFNKVVFKCLLPASLFFNVSTTSFREVVNLPLILFCVLGTLAVFFGCVLLVPRVARDRRRAAVIEQAIYRGNYVIFGLVVIEGFFPEQLGVASVVSAFLIPTYNTLAVVLLESAGGGHVNVKKTVRGVVTNPLILANVLGLLFSLTGLSLPGVLKSYVQSLAKMSSTAGLLGVGMCFEFKTLRKNARALGASVLCKLVLLPVIMCLLGVWWFDFRDAELMITLIAFGAPTAVSSYTMAQMYDVDHDLANQEVVATTLGCIVTLAALIWAFTQTPFLTL